MGGCDDNLASRLATALSQAGVGAVPLADLRWAAIQLALNQAEGNRTHAAKLLGISVRTLQRHLKAGPPPESA